MSEKFLENFFAIKGYFYFESDFTRKRFLKGVLKKMVEKSRKNF
jgi:hypothetical protein